MTFDWKKEGRDQSLHFAAAFVILALASIGGPISMGVAGFLCGAIREITEEGNPVTRQKILKGLLTGKLDLAFWTAGGVAAGFIL